MRVSCAVIWGVSIPGRVKSKCKGPVVDVRQACSDNSKEAIVTEVSQIMLGLWSF